MANKVVGKLHELTLTVVRKGSSCQGAISFETPYLILQESADQQYRWWSEKTQWAHYDLNCQQLGLGDILVLNANYTDAGTLQRVKILRVDQSNHREW